MSMSSKLSSAERRSVGEANVLGQEIVDLVKSQVALLAPELDETL